MTYPHRPATGGPIRPEAERLRPWTVTPQGTAARVLSPTRRYEILWLDDRGEVLETSRVAPAMPAIESAFAAFARGALVATPLGEVAIEDLVPGMPVNTRVGPRPVRWIGRILMPPSNLRQDSGPDLYRFAADSFGAMHPSPDLVLASAARRVHRTPRLSQLGGAPEVLVPVGDFADGISVTQLNPMSAVQVYHFMLDAHAVIEVNGMEVETFHPGRELDDGFSPEMARLFLSLFPQLDGGRSFGPLVMPRGHLDELDSHVLTA